MSGETDLKTLLSSMSPALSSEPFVFVTSKASLHEVAALEPWALICEDEGVTVILPKAQADRHHLQYESTFRRITLTVTSSLEAIGFTAAISAELAAQQISVNVVAAYYHDHLFVGEDKAEKAIRVLQRLSTEKKSSHE